MKPIKEFINKNDLKIFKILNVTLHKNFINPIMVSVTALGTVTFVLITTFIITYLNFAAARFLIVNIIISQAIVHLIKLLVKRPRPHEVYHEWMNNVRKPPKDFSLPSGHTASFMTIALCLSRFFPMLFIPLIILAILVGISRVYLGCHYPTDVLLAYFISISCYNIILYFPLILSKINL